MKNQIKELRVKIDGLAQLTKRLKPLNPIILDLEKTKNLPHGMEVEEVLDLWHEQGIGFEGFITPVNNNRELQKAVDNLYLAKAWLGKVLFEIGDTNPYAEKDGNRKSVEDIEPTADKANLIRDIDYLTQYKKITEKKNHIEKVDWLREEIKTIVDKTEDFSQKEPHIELEQGFVYKYLCETRFWLGFELQRSKEMKDEQ